MVVFLKEFGGRAMSFRLKCFVWSIFHMDVVGFVNLRLIIGFKYGIVSKEL